MMIVSALKFSNQTYPSYNNNLNSDLVFILNILALESIYNTNTNVEVLYTLLSIQNELSQFS